MSERIPEGWEWNYLKDVIGKITSGGTPKVGNEDYYDGDIPFLKISDLTACSRTIFTSEETITEKALAETSTKVFPAGTVVTTMYGTIGVTRFLGRPMATNQAIAAFLQLKGIVAEFLFHVINRDAEKLSSLSSQTTQANISATVLKKHLILTPPLKEQKKIASILTSIDNVVENLQKQIDKLQDLKKATMNELLTKGTSHTELKDTELGKIPKNWEIFSTSSLYEFKNGLNKEKKAFGRGHRIVNYMDVFSRPEISEEDLNGRVQLSKNEIERFSVSSGDLFFTRTSETPLEIGLSSVLTKVSEDVCFSGFILRAKPVNKKIFTKLSGRLYRCDYIRKQIVRTCSYTTRALTNGTSLGKVLVALPSIEEQKEIYTVLKSIEKNIEDKQIEKNKYIFFKKSIMQDLLTGKIRVQVS